MTSNHDFSTDNYLINIQFYVIISYGEFRKLLRSLSVSLFSACHYLRIDIKIYLGRRIESLFNPQSNILFSIEILYNNLDIRASKLTIPYENIDIQ